MQHILLFIRQTQRPYAVNESRVIICQVLDTFEYFILFPCYYIKKSSRHLLHKNEMVVKSPVDELNQQQIFVIFQ